MSRAQLPPDPEAYDSPRAAQARARGLAAPYIAGGHDPDLERDAARGAAVPPDPADRDDRRRRALGLRARASSPSCSASTSCWAPLMATAVRRRSAEAWALAHDRLVEIAARPDPDPVDQPAGPAGRRARRRPLPRRRARATPASRRRSTSPCPGAAPSSARLRGDGTGGAPLLLLSHLDVVPAPPDGWTHDPFAGDVADGWIYGRGAVDMKDLVAMELEVMRLLAERGARRRPRPGVRPGPGPRAATSCSPRPPTRRPAASPAPAGSRSSTRSTSAPRRRSTRPAASRSTSAAGASTRSRSPRRASTDVPADVPRDVGPRLDAPRGQRDRARRRGGRPPRRARGRRA